MSKTFRPPRLLLATLLLLVPLLNPATTAEEPATLPAPVPAQADEDDDSRDDPGNHIQVDLIEAGTRYELDGTGESSLRVSFAVKSTKGRDWLSQVYFPYLPEFEALRYEGIRTIHPDGRVDELAASEVLERDAPQQIPGIVHDVRLLGFAPRALAVGDSLEFRLVRTHRRPIKPGDFWGMHDRLYPFPVKREVVVLDLPLERAVSFFADPAHPYTTTEADGRRVRRWELQREAYRPPDRGEEDRHGSTPLYRVSTLSSWSEVATWYLALQGERAHPTDQLVALAARLTEKAETPRAKLDALYAHVANQVRYLGMELGLGIIQPHTAAEVVRNGYGDCKDKHTLLAALLEAVGLAADPVLLSIDRDVAPEEPPVPFSFDHVITEVHLAEGPVWVDATVPFAPAGLLGPAVGGRKALRIQASGGTWIDLPVAPPFHAFLRTSTTGRLAASGDLTLEASLETRGADELFYRQMLAVQENDAGSKAFAKGLALSWPGIEVTVSEKIDPHDVLVPMRLAWKGQGRFVSPGEKRAEREVAGAGIDLWAFSALQEEFADLVSERRRAAGKETTEEEKIKGAKPRPLPTGGPVERVHTVRLEVDSTFTLDLPLPVELKTSFGSYRSTYRFADHVLEVVRTLEIREGTVPMERRAELARFRKVVTRDLDQKVVFHRTGAFDAIGDAATLDRKALLAAGKAAAESDDHESAAAYYSQAVAKDGKDAEALAGLGDAYLETARPQRAEPILRRLLEVEPEHEDGWNALGVSLEMLGRVEEAEAAYRKQLEIDPFHARVPANLARLVQKSGKEEEALAWLEKAMALDRDNARLHFALGDVLLDLGRKDLAREHLDRALEQDRSIVMRARVARRRAEAGLDAAGSRATAEAVLRQASADLAKSDVDAVAPDYPETLAAVAESLHVLGAVATRAGKLPEAESYLRAAHSILPGQASARALAELLTRRDNKNEALEFWAYYRRQYGAKTPMPPALLEYARLCFGKEIEEKLDLLGMYLGSDHEIHPPKDTLHGPKGANAVVHLRVAVDATGKVTKVRVLEGEEPHRSAAEKDIQRLPWTPLRWPGKSLDTLREVLVLYMEDGSGGAWWYYPVSEVEGRIVRLGSFTPKP